MTYAGDASIGSDCLDDLGGALVSWTSNNPGGGFSPNDVVFTPSSPVVTPAPGTCTISFGVQVLNPSTDGTPQLAEVAAGFNGACDNGLEAAAEPTAAFQLLDCRVDLDKYVCVDHDDDPATQDICWGVGEPGGSGYNLDDKAYTFYATYENIGEDDLGDCILTDTIYGDIPIDPLLPSGASNTVELGGGLCSDDFRESNTATISCGLCGAPDAAEAAVEASDDSDITCYTCEASLDKQVAGEEPWDYVDIDGGDDPDGNEIISTIGWLDDDEVNVRYVLTNTGDVDLVSCSLVDSNGIIDASIFYGPDETLLVGEQVAFELRDPGDGFNCSAEFEDMEPNTATLDCICDATIGGEPIDPLLPDFGVCPAGDMDTANVICQSAEVDVEKVCDEAVDGINAVTVTVSNMGEADLENCVVTDEYTPKVDGVPQPPVSLDLDCGEAPNTISNLPSGASVDCTGSIADLEEEADNDVHVICGIVGSRKSVEDEGSDACEVPGEGCFTRTIGYWGNHPDSTFWALDGGLYNCNVWIDHVDTGQGSAIEDICSVGAKEFKPNKTTNTQLQIERQCMAAALNLSATRLLEGSCESEMPGVTEVFEDCCGVGDDDESVCNGDVSTGGRSLNSCIDYLDTFNNYPFDELDDTSLCPSDITGFEPPCSADSSVCREAKGNHFINAERDRQYKECKGKNCPP
jgi:hypothetical protein